ncbi:MAG: hypothetical protein KA778_13115 [Burkholderiaceae bacterium]|nr:hypothetical protein [Burkholderiaceae bacterium]
MPERVHPLARTRPAGPFATCLWALLIATGLGVPAPALAQFSAAGSAAAESAAESATRRDGVASYGRHNVYRAGRTVRSGDPLEGDFHAAGSRVVVDAQVQGDALMLGGTVEVRAPVGGDLRTLAGKVLVDGQIGGDAVIGGVEISLERQSRVSGDALIAGRSVDIRGTVGGELTVYAQQISIAGPVSGKVRLVAEEIELLAGARIDGALSYTSPNELKQAPGVVVAGQITRIAREKPGEDDRAARDRNGVAGMSWGLLGSVLWSMGLFAFGAAMLSAFPGFTMAAADRAASEPLAAFGLGLALTVTTPVAAGLAILTIVGIPLGAAVLAVYPVLILVGYLTGVWSVAARTRRLLGARSPGSRPVLLGWLAGALVVLLLVGVVPFLGWMIAAWVTLAGLGGMAMTLWQRRALNR